MPTAQGRGTDRGRGRLNSPNTASDASNYEYPDLSQRVRGRSQRSPAISGGRGRRDDTKLGEESYAAFFKTNPVGED